MNNPADANAELQQRLEQILWSLMDKLSADDLKTLAYGCGITLKQPSVVKTYEDLFPMQDEHDHRDDPPYF